MEWLYGTSRKECCQFESVGRSIGPALSTNKAAMIAAAAYSRFRAGMIADTSLNAAPSLSLAWKNRLQETAPRCRTLALCRRSCVPWQEQDERR